MLGAVAGDLVHLLAELLDNALRYSPPISQVRVSAVHTRQRRTRHRGQRHRPRHDRVRPAGGEHATAVRRRGQPVHRAPHGALRGRSAGRAARTRRPVCAARSRENRIRAPPRGCTSLPSFCCGVRRRSRPTRRTTVSPSPTQERCRDRAARSTRSTSTSSGTSRHPSPSTATATSTSRFPFCRNATRAPAASRAFRRCRSSPSHEPVSDWPEDEWPEDSMPAQTHIAPRAGARRRSRSPRSGRPRPRRTRRRSSPRGRRQPSRPTNGAHPPVAAPSRPPTDSGPVQPEQAGAPSPTAGSDDAIFQKMLSEWLIDDPTELAQSTDLDWKTVWDSGW